VPNVSAPMASISAKASTPSCSSLYASTSSQSNESSKDCISKSCMVSSPFLSYLPACLHAGGLFRVVCTTYTYV